MRNASRSNSRAVSSTGVAVDGHLARVEVEAHGPDLERRLVAARAAGERAQPGEQLLDRKRLGQVVVGAGVEPDHAVADAVERRQHQDRHVVARAAGAAAHAEAVHVGQAHVEDHQVGLLALHRREALGAGAGELDAVARLAQLELEHAGDRGVVLDDQDTLGRGGHAPTIAALWRPLRILTKPAARLLPAPRRGIRRGTYGGIGNNS